jgi:micrococcal nuclease
MGIFTSSAALLGIILGASCLVLVGCGTAGAGITSKSSAQSPATTVQRPAEPSPAVATPATTTNADQASSPTAPVKTGTAPSPAVTTPSPPAALETVRVVRTIDGDTIEVERSNKQRVQVRLIGVDTPETVHPSKPVQPYGPEASAYTKERLTGKTVQLEYDVERTDKYGRTLAYVWLGQELFNATLVQEGYAQVMTIPPNVKYADLFVQLQVKAREAKRGLWGLEAQPTEAAETPPKPSAAPSSAPKRGRFAPRNGQCVEDGVRYIKGNRNSMIYHSPGGQFYDKTYAEDCFYTAADAQAAGYRASKR